jgi:hypothetical protein
MVQESRSSMPDGDRRRTARRSLHPAVGDTSSEAIWLRVWKTLAR